MPETANLTFHLATDHAGLTHKNILKDWLLAKGFVVVDHGAETYDADDDFPDFISKAAAAVSVDPERARGFIFGGSGNGEAMLANRYQGVRAAVYYGQQKEIVTLSRTHNNANMLAIGARFVSESELLEVAKIWIETSPLPDLKYSRRNEKIEQLTRLNRNL